MTTIQQLLDKKYGNKKAKTPRAALERVLWLLSQRGRWIKGSYGDSDDSERCCLIGAIRQVDGPAEERALSLMEETLPKDFEFDNVENFNDDEDTDLRRVKKFLKHAITQVGKRKPKPFEV